MKEVTFVFEPELWNNNGKYTLETLSDVQKVSDWFQDLNSWKVEDEYETISFEPFQNKIKCTFTSLFTDDSDILIEYLLDPDDDGNHPIQFGNEEYLCMGNSIKLIEAK
jgi:hypothetical protein